MTTPCGHDQNGINRILPIGSGRKRASAPSAQKTASGLVLTSISTTHEGKKAKSYSQALDKLVPFGFFLQKNLR
jgi:hypothetical protein